MVTPIETQYEGCLFRSRLEARWAVFMDTLGLTWRYEPEGFELSDGTRYLPDFYVDGIGWLEIKPSKETDDGKFEKFCNEHITIQGFRAFLIAGDIPSPSYDDIPNEDRFYIGGFFGGMYGGGLDSPYAWCVCTVCGKIGIEYDGRGERICKEHKMPERYSAHLARIKMAFIAARSVRF